MKFSVQTSIQARVQDFLHGGARFLEFGTKRRKNTRSEAKRDFCILTRIPLSIFHLTLVPFHTFFNILLFLLSIFHLTLVSFHTFFNILLFNFEHFSPYFSSFSGIFDILLFLFGHFSQ